MTVSRRFRSSRVYTSLTRRGLPSLRILTLIAIILSTSVFTALYVEHRYFTADGLQNFGNHGEVRFYLQTHQQRGIPEYGFWGITPDMEAFSGFDTPRTLSYSTTNIQVSGVDELDIVKTNGTFIYTIVKDEVIIVRAYPPESAEITGRITPTGNPLGLFLYDSNRLVVISQGLSIEVFDVSYPSNPQRINWVTYEGYFIGVRLIQNKIYLIAGTPTHDTFGNTRIPTIGIAGTWGTIFNVLVPASQIYYDPKTIDTFFQYTSILTLDVSAPAALPDVKCFLMGTSGATVYVSQNNLYLATHQWFAGSVTTIHRLQIMEDTVVYAASGSVPGYLLNQFSLDEYEDHLRVFTTYYDVNSRQVSGLSILNMQLEVVGSIEGLAPNEQIYSSRFLGKMGFLVTFYMVDPLFVFNLTDPTNPQLLGELKIPGYSNYLHPLDSNQLLGIGKDAKIQGDNWWYQGMKISLFNTTNPFDPQESTNLILGVRGTDSEALNDHKAILVDSEKGLLSMPIRLCEYVTNSTDVDPREYG
ncbi:MAG: beta-propeller domain-containing protein, partial [Candidatus Hermodarchaeia archaeon]